MEIQHDVTEDNIKYWNIFDKIVGVLLILSFMFFIPFDISSIFKNFNLHNTINLIASIFVLNSGCRFLKNNVSEFERGMIIGVIGCVIVIAFTKI